MAPTLLRKEFHDFISLCERLISCSLIDKVPLSSEECGIIEFYVSELLALTKEINQPQHAALATQPPATTQPGNNKNPAA